MAVKDTVMNKSSFADVILIIFLIVVSALLTHRYTMNEVEERLASGPSAKFMVLNFEKLTTEWKGLTDDQIGEAATDLVNGYSSQGYIIIDRSMSYGKFHKDYEVPIPSIEEIKAFYKWE